MRIRDATGLDDNWRKLRSDGVANQESIIIDLRKIGYSKEEMFFVFLKHIARDHIEI